MPVAAKQAHTLLTKQMTYGAHSVYVAFAVQPFHL
jgi:hypothetical protein